MNRKLNLSLVLCVALSGAAFGTVMSADPELESHGPSQAAADVLRDVTNADAAFLPAGMVKPLAEVSDLAQLLVYPTDTVSVVKLSGTQLKSALERSVSLVPLPSSAFLQVSGIEATYSKSAPAEKRLTKITVSGSILDEDRIYNVAMPTTLARGGLGYFKVWNRENISRTLEDQTLESILKGKPSRSTGSRWIAQ